MRYPGLTWMLLLLAWAQGRASGLVELTAPARVGALAEFRVTGVPTVTHPTDPDVVTVDARWQAPTGRPVVVPAFWFRDYQRALVDGREVLTPSGRGEWRLRYRPWQAGTHGVVLTVTTNGQPAGGPFLGELVVSSNPEAVPGVVKVESQGRHFERDGRPFPLVGQCVCWPGARGTHDYDTWFGTMGQAGENYARLWMAPWAFGIEAEPGTLTQYRQDRAWQLDYVFALAEQQGIGLMLCLDFHGMFEVDPDYWGGNNFWPQNPYNGAQGGPCADQKAFFANAEPRRVYQKRLRYLVARYSHSPALIAWQFFNEIDNVYDHLDPAAVADWHSAMAGWLHAADPQGHLVTTSLTGGSERPEIWSLPGLDFSMYHSYGQPDPVVGLAAKVDAMGARYGKPVMVGELGVSWQGWKPEEDPYGRALRQGIWAGIVGGSVGTSMAWFWESMHEANYAPFYRVIGDFTRQTHLGRGNWKPLQPRQAPPPPVTVGDALPGGLPFSATLSLNPNWGAKPAGALAVANPDSAVESPGALAGFVHGTGHPELKSPFRLSAWFGADAKAVLHVNSVSDGARASVWVDGTRTWEKSLPNLDGEWLVNNEYNTDYEVALPAGSHLVEVRNTGGDWFFLDWVRLEQVLPAAYAGGWAPVPVVVGMAAESETLVYVAVPKLRYPAKVPEATLPLQEHLTVTLSNCPPASYVATWIEARDGKAAGVTTAEVIAGGSLLTLPLPPFREDLVGRILKRPTIACVRAPGAGAAILRVDRASGLDGVVEGSLDFRQWTMLRTFTNLTGTIEWELTPSAALPFYRAKVD